MKRFILFSLVGIVALASCTKDSATPVTIISGTKTISVPFSSATAFTLFRFSDSTVVANTDSASNKWDFGLRFTTFIVNSYAGGPGSAGTIAGHAATGRGAAPAAARCAASAAPPPAAAAPRPGRRHTLQPAHQNHCR